MHIVGCTGGSGKRVVVPCVVASASPISSGVPAGEVVTVIGWDSGLDSYICRSCVGVGIRRGASLTTVFVVNKVRNGRQGRWEVEGLAGSWSLDAKRNTVTHLNVSEVRSDGDRHGVEVDLIARDFTHGVASKHGAERWDSVRCRINQVGVTADRSRCFDLRGRGCRPKVGFTFKAC